MDLVYLATSIGGAGFLLYSLTQYVNALSKLRPKATSSKQQIRTCEAGIDEAEKETYNIKRSVDSINREIGGLEKQLKELDQKIAVFRAQEVQAQEREERQNPHRLEREEEN